MKADFCPFFQRFGPLCGVTPGKCLTLGQIHIDLCGLLCEAHIVPDEFPIDTDGLLGLDMLSKYEGQTKAGKTCLEINHLTVPFSKEEQFVIPPNTRQIIYAHVLNEKEEAGFVPLQNLGPGLLFGNFVATNKEGKAYALCYKQATRRWQ